MILLPTAPRDKKMTLRQIFLYSRKHFMFLQLRIIGFDYSLNDLLKRLLYKSIINFFFK